VPTPRPRVAPRTPSWRCSPTPLSPILAWARLLRQGALDAEKTERALETIERSARSQAQLVDDLLDVSRIVAGKLRLQVRPMQLTAAIEAGIEVVRPAAEAKCIRIQTALDTETGAIAGDPERLQQVVWNLLSNAIKFTPKGGRIQVTLERVNSHVEIAVSDTGQGVPEEFLPHLFEHFQQAETGTTRSHGGLGLGLAIVRHIVELHGGTVHAESPGEGKGTTVTVKLPRMIFARTAGEIERRHPTLGASPGNQDNPQLSALRVLVVDDEPDSNEVVRMLLVSCGAEVRVAGSAARDCASSGAGRPTSWSPTSACRARTAMRSSGKCGRWADRWRAFPLLRSPRTRPPATASASASSRPDSRCTS